jgi:hypothetical protein
VEKDHGSIHHTIASQEGSHIHAHVVKTLRELTSTHTGHLTDPDHADFPSKGGWLKPIKEWLTMRQLRALRDDPIYANNPLALPPSLIKKSLEPSLEILTIQDLTTLETIMKARSQTLNIPSDLHNRTDYHNCHMCDGPNPSECSIPHLLFECPAFIYERHHFMEALRVTLEAHEYDTLLTCSIAASTGLLSGDSLGPGSIPALVITASFLRDIMTKYHCDIIP